MNQQKKEWVFTKLVQDPNNIEQLLSYAVYKGFKDEIAQTARNANKTELQIEAELTQYHDQCLQSEKQLAVFKSDAKAILTGYTERVNNVLFERFSKALNKHLDEKNKTIEDLNKKLKSAEKTALKNLMEGAEEYRKKINKPTGLGIVKAYSWAFIKYLFSGVPKLIATAFSLGLMFAIYASFTGDGTTALRKGLYKTVDTFVPAKAASNESKEADNKSNGASGENG